MKEEKMYKVGCGGGFIESGSSCGKIDVGYGGGKCGEEDWGWKSQPTQEEEIF